MRALALPAARAVVLRPASTVLLLRDGAAGVEVLMVRRSPNASFMPGAHVFPGGAVDAADADAACDETAAALTDRIGRVTGVGDRAAACAVAALRECLEECSLRLVAADGAWATSRLQPWSHWVTPLGLHKRFDTLFFVCRAPAGQQPRHDDGETTAFEWVAPAAALAAHAAGRFAMEFATVETVRSLLPFAGASVQAILDHAAAQASLPPLHPRVRLDAERRIVGVLLPGQDGWDALEGDGT